MGYAVKDFVIKQELRENAVEKPGVGTTFRQNGENNCERRIK